MNQRAFVLALLAFFLFAPRAHAEGPISLADYRGVLDQAIRLVEQAAPQSAANQRAALAQAADLLANVHQVQLDTGASLAVDNTNLIELLRSNSTRSDVALSRLRAQRGALDDLPRVADANDRAKLRDLLSRPPFAAQPIIFNNPFAQWIEQFQQWLAGLFDDAARGVYNSRDVITLLGIVIVALVLVYFLHGFIRNVAPEAALKLEETEEIPLSSAEALERAQHFVSDGNYRSAIRQLYLATLLLLDERGRLRYDRALTNREYLRLAAAEPAIGGALQPIVETFDRTWYGFAPVTTQEFETYQQQIEAVIGESH